MSKLVIEIPDTSCIILGRLFFQNIPLLTFSKLPSKLFKLFILAKLPNKLFKLFILNDHIKAITRLGNMYVGLFYRKLCI